MTDTWNYERAEIDKALNNHPADEPLRIKISGERGETRWMNVSPAKARKIQEILSQS